MSKKCGFVAIVGKPNVGKSSLVNSMVGAKVSITGPKPQTTRNKILGIKTEEDYQLVFVDTPGTIKPQNALGEYMQKSITTATIGVDAIVVVIDATKISESDYKLVEKYKKEGVPVFVCINKTDISKFDKVYPKLAKLNELDGVVFVSTSAKTGKGVDELVSKLVEILPESDFFMYDKDQITDKSVKFLVAEIVREKALLFLQEEVPHGIAVDIPKFEEKKNLININAEIVATKQNHKQIIIGKQGEMLKKIGTSARQEIEQLVDKKVNLQLFVKIRENWQDNTLSLRDFGYDKKDV